MDERSPITSPSSSRREVPARSSSPSGQAVTTNSEGTPLPAASSGSVSSITSGGSGGGGGLRRGGGGARDPRAMYLSHLGLGFDSELRRRFSSLLEHDDIDLEALRQMCYRHGVPRQYRSLVWKILLNVLSPLRSTWAFAQKQRKDHYDDLKRTAIVTNRFSEHWHWEGKGGEDGDFPEGEALRHKAALLCDVFNLERELRARMNNTVNHSVDQGMLTHIARLFCSMITSEVDAYWCLAHHMRNETYSVVVNETAGVFAKINDTGRLLKEHAARLWTHLRATDFPWEEVATAWFQGYLIERLPREALARSWDRIIAGCHRFLAHVACAVIMSQQSTLLSMTDGAEIAQHLMDIPDVDTDQVIHKAVELCISSGAFDKEKMPPLRVPTPVSSLGSPMASNRRVKSFDHLPQPPQIHGHHRAQTGEPDHRLDSIFEELF